MSVTAEILPANVYCPGAIVEYNPPFPTAPYAVPVVDRRLTLRRRDWAELGAGVQLVELIAVTLASFAKKFTDGAFTPKL